MQGVESSVEVLCGSFLLFCLLRLFSLRINERVHTIHRKPAPNEEKVWKSKDAKKMYFLTHILTQVE